MFINQNGLILHWAVECRIATTREMQGPVQDAPASREHSGATHTRVLIIIMYGIRQCKCTKLPSGTEAEQFFAKKK